jgi:hypothetical protein
MADYSDLKPYLRGELIQADDSNYDDARKLSNAMIDKKPAAIARCVDVADVMACVNDARSNECAACAWTPRAEPRKWRADACGVTWTMPPIPLAWPQPAALFHHGRRRPDSRRW